MTTLPPFDWTGRAGSAKHGRWDPPGHDVVAEAEATVAAADASPHPAAPPLEPARQCGVCSAWHPSDTRCATISLRCTGCGTWHQPTDLCPGKPSLLERWSVDLGARRIDWGLLAGWAVAAAVCGVFWAGVTIAIRGGV